MWNEAAGRTWIVQCFLEWPQKVGLFFFSIKKVETEIKGQFDIVFLLPPRWMDEWMDR